MRPIQLSVRRLSTQPGASGGSQFFGLRQSHRVQIDQRRILLHCQLADRRYVGHVLVALDLSAGFEIPADDGRDQNRGRAHAARLVHVSGHVGAIGGVGIGLPLRPFPRIVVVAELNQYVPGLCGERRRPRALIAKTLRAAPVAGQIEALDRRTERSPEARSPASLVVDSGIADQHDFVGCAAAGARIKAAVKSAKGRRDMSYFAAVIESTWMVFVFASSVPFTITFFAANFSAFFWSLSV